MVDSIITYQYSRPVLLELWIEQPLSMTEVALALLLVRSLSGLNPSLEIVYQMVAPHPEDLDLGQLIELDMALQDPSLCGQTILDQPIQSGRILLKNEVVAQT